MTKWNRLLLLLIGLFVMVGCDHGIFQSQPSKKVLTYKENFEITGSEAENKIGKVNPALFTTVDRSNTLAKEFQLPVVPQEGDEFNLPSGRYNISGRPTGNIFIYDKSGELILREIVGSYAGVSSLTIDIDETYTVRVDGGYDSVSIFPVTTQFSTELTAGIWEVGLDIEAGDYTITTPYGLGYLHIFNNDNAIIYELIGGTTGSTTSEVQLKTGQKLRVTGVSIIHFQPQE